MHLAKVWNQKYQVLKDYIKSNPGIYIDMNEVSIPENLRDGFYKRFDDVRNAFVNERFGNLPVEMDTICRNYILAEKELTRILGIKDVELPVDLSSFLHNPKESLGRGIFRRLFEMVQGRIPEDDFERMADNDLVSGAWEMFRLGYESWMALSLILMLEPDEAFGVELDEDFEPFVVKLKEIAFGRQFHHPAKRIPEFILHSKKLDTHIAVKMPLAREVGAYYIPFEPPKKTSDRTGDTSFVLDYRMIFLSVVNDLKKIPVFADIHARTIKGPDMMIEFLMEQDLADSETVSQVQKRVEIMKPVKGCTAVIMNPEPESDDVKTVGNFNTFAVGLDPSKLQQIIDKLI